MGLRIVLLIGVFVITASAGVYLFWSVNGNVSGSVVAEECLEREYCLVEIESIEDEEIVISKSIERGCFGRELEYGGIIFTDGPDENGDGMIDGETFELRRRFEKRDVGECVNA